VCGRRDPDLPYGVQAARLLPHQPRASPPVFTVFNVIHSTPTQRREGARGEVTLPRSLYSIIEYEKILLLLLHGLWVCDEPAAAWNQRPGFFQRPGMSPGSSFSNRALYLPTFSHLLTVNELLSRCAYRPSVTS